MPQLFPVAKSKIHLGPAVTTVPDEEDIDVTDFTSVTPWTEIKGWQTMGSVGDAAALITEAVISAGRDLKAKGTRNAGSMQNNFIVLPDDPGQIALIAAEATSYNYPFKITFDDAPPADSSVVTMTIATPGVVSWTGHGLAINDPVKFSTTGALPTGLTAGTTYYVKTTPDADTFTVSTTPGGSAVTTSGSQSGVQTATTVPSPTTKYFYGIVMSAQEQGGGANTARLLAGNVEINSPVITVAPAGGA